mmetsp:Transcript_31004/g.57841  ORF Transcript_31004/g.57841 Transcript_31004/m.57841 type:complete len:696 (-) Transcript_31004:221-2308(-)
MPFQPNQIIRYLQESEIADKKTRRKLTTALRRPLLFKALRNPEVLRQFVGSWPELNKGHLENISSWEIYASYFNHISETLSNTLSNDELSMLGCRNPKDQTMTKHLLSKKITSFVALLGTSDASGLEIDARIALTKWNSLVEEKSKSTSQTSSSKRNFPLLQDRMRSLVPFRKTHSNKIEVKSRGVMIYAIALCMFRSGEAAIKLKIGNLMRSNETLVGLIDLLVECWEFDERFHGRIRAVFDQLEKFLNSEESVQSWAQNLGIAFLTLGWYQKALDTFTKIRSSTAPELKDRCASVLTNIAIAYGGLGNVPKKIELLSEALVIKKNLHSKEHPDVTNVSVNLANAYVTAGKPEKALPIFLFALESIEKRYGKSHLKIASILVNLSNTHYTLGDYKSQLTVLQRALHVKETHYGKTHWQLIAVLSNLGVAYGKTGEPETSKAHIERAYNIAKIHYGKEHVKTASILVNLGVARGKLGNFAQMRDNIQEALDILKKHHDRHKISKALTNLANAHEKLGDFEDQKCLLKEACSIKVALYGESHPLVARTLANLANAHGHLGELKEKYKLLQRTKDILDKYYGTFLNFELIWVSIDLASMHDSMGDAKASVVGLSKIVKSLEMNENASIPRIALVTALIRLADVLHRQCPDDENAVAHINRSLDIMDSYGYPETDEHRIKARDVLRRIEASHYNFTES